MPQTVIFLCPHNAAKSVIAAALFTRLAEQRGLAVQVCSAGTDPAAEVAPAVVALLRAEGIDVSDHHPQRATADALAAALHIVSMGCDVSDLAPDHRIVQRWDDVPAPSKDLNAAVNAIRSHIESLVIDLQPALPEREEE